MSEVHAFESALAANPDDLAGWCAYADYLIEHGDPRGAFMQVQIALEDESRSRAERDALKEREAELLAEHERAWLGELAPFVLDAKPVYPTVRRMAARFTRGRLGELLCRCFSVDEARTLARAPEVKMLSRLLIESTAYEVPKGTRGRSTDSYYEPGPDVPSGLNQYQTPALHALARAPVLANVRVFLFGDGPTDPGEDEGAYGACHANGEFVHMVVSRMPRLEELYLYAHDVDAATLFALPMNRLRVLRFDHARNYPFDVLAANPALGSLTHLLCHPHAQIPDDPDAYIRLDQLRAVCRAPHLMSLTHLQLRLTDFGDDGITEIVESGVLKRLRVLDISYGCVTDDGARALAACPDLKHLHRLDLTMNALTDEGIAALAATGVTFTAEHQHDEHPTRMGENGYLDYLSCGDME
jgi:uncharacterized protein (TIGR02996 family)